jgi:hypothetical protein
MTTDEIAPRPAGTAAERSTLGTVVRALTALSIAGFLVLILGSVLSWKGFSSDESDVSTLADVTWSTFALAGILALVTGVVAWIRGRAGHRPADVRAGQTAIGWVALALAVSFIWSALA